MENKNYQMVRYADNFIIMCKTRELAEEALKMVKEWTDEAELILHPEKTKILDLMQDEIGFLGYRFLKSRNYEENKLIWKFPKRKSIKKFKDSIRKHTKRKNGKSLKQIIEKINPIIRGWFEYYKHSYKTTFPDLDGWIRRRLRSILKRHEKRRGIATTHKDNFRYPNKIFEDAGLLSLTETIINYVNLYIRSKLLSGEPYAGEPHVRFGGRGVSNGSTPTPILKFLVSLPLQLR